MQPTELSDLLDRVSTLLALAPVQRPDIPPGDASLFASPGPDLSVTTRSFADVYGPEVRLLAQLATAADASGNPALADMFLQFENGITNHSLRPVPTQGPVQRLVGFVYPVV